MAGLLTCSLLRAGHSKHGRLPVRMRHDVAAQVYWTVAILGRACQELTAAGTVQDSHLIPSCLSLWRTKAAAKVNKQSGFVSSSAHVVVYRMGRVANDGILRCVFWASFNP